MTKGFYDLECPTTWAEVPERFSFSGLQAISACPRKWQLLRSTWGEHGRFPQRLHPKAVEGSIVHEAIELLVRALGRRGMPSIGSKRFQEAVEDVDFWGYFAREIERSNKQLVEHPRSGPVFVLRTPPCELANRAIRLLREQYKPLDAEPLEEAEQQIPQEEAESPIDPMGELHARGSLSEFRVTHPTLPFHGIIDLVQLIDSEVQVVDFKTGTGKDEHHLQLQLYALLWWRRTGARPTRLTLQYLNQRKEFCVDEAQLTAAERKLEADIVQARRVLTDTPAEARPSKDCGFCPARARCDAGWQAYQTTLGRPREGTTDIEVAVTAPPSLSGFLAEAAGREVDVVFEAAVGKLLPGVKVGERVRLLDVVVRDEGKTFEIRPWTEVYRVVD